MKKISDLLVKSILDSFITNFNSYLPGSPSNLGGLPCTKLIASSVPISTISESLKNIKLIKNNSRNEWINNFGYLFKHENIPGLFASTSTNKIYLMLSISLSF